MQQTALVLGLIGGAIGLVASLLTPFLGDRAIPALLCAIVAMVGAGISRAHPRTGAALMLLAAVAGTVAVVWLWALPAVLLLVAGILALLGARDTEPSRMAA
jgi:hypothetical protein